MSLVASTLVRRIIAMFAIITAGGSFAVARSHRHVQKLRVRLIAASTEVHGTFGMNEDDFLAELISQNDGRGRLVLSVGEYVSGTLPLSHTVLTSRSETVLRLRRDATCDQSFRKIPLRAAPGNPIAILPIQLRYHLDLLNPPDNKALIPCYRTVHR